ncbi:hypothetical protein V8F20_007715 [Naviculisporaceae sp. PSN 640]
MSPSTLRSAALVALAVASTGLTAPLANITTQEAKEAEYEYEDLVLAFDTRDCRKVYGNELRISFDSDTRVPQYKHSLYVYDVAAAFGSWEFDKYGRTTCSGEFYGYLEYGCHDVEKSFYNSIRCIRPVPEGWLENSSYDDSEDDSGDNLSYPQDDYSYFEDDYPYSGKSYDGGYYNNKGGSSYYPGYKNGGYNGGSSYNRNKVYDYQVYDNKAYDDQDDYDDYDYGYSGHGRVYGQPVYGKGGYHNGVYDGVYDDAYDVEDAYNNGYGNGYNNKVYNNHGPYGGNGYDVKGHGYNHGYSGHGNGAYHGYDGVYEDKDYYNGHYDGHYDSHYDGHYDGHYNGDYNQEVDDDHKSDDDKKHHGHRGHDGKNQNGESWFNQGWGRSSWGPRGVALVQTEAVEAAPAQE